MTTLRPATPEDIPLLQQLARTIWHRVYTALITPEQTDLMLARMYATATLRQEMAGGVVWQILEEDHLPIGYTSYSMIAAGVCKLHKLYIHPDYHGKGLGKRLMKEAVAYARQHGAGTLVLMVNRGNEKALRAYRAFGFQIAESVDWEFAPGFILHDYTMKLTL